MTDALSREFSSYYQIKIGSQAAQSHQNQQYDRFRAAVVLLLDFLQSRNYAASVAQIEKETNISLQNYQVCDNVDLLGVLTDFEEFYKFRFGRPPKIFRKAQKEARERSQDSRPRTPNVLDKIVQKNLGVNTADSALVKAAQQNASRTPMKKPPRLIYESLKKIEENSDTAEDLGVGISGVSIPNSQVKQLANPPERYEAQPYRPVLKAPPPDFPTDLLSFYYVVQNEIITEHPMEDFSSIVGLEQAKQTLSEAVIMPQKYPQLFQGILSPWKGCLLYSSPGNGKSHLARALASECGCAFFNISAASLLSKYYGESEKLVRCLFLVARAYERSVIFIDELDCLMTSRAEEGEHEASKRLKTQLLVEIDGLSTQKQQIFVLAATNLPWTIDSAMLRRLEKRVFIRNLTHEGRAALISLKLGDRMPKQSKDAVIAYLAQQTEGWSGSDICCLCKECAMIKLRSGLTRLESGDTGVIDLTVGMEEAQRAVAVVHPSYALEMQYKYEEWDKRFGSV